jgi:VWFA-related protein
MHSPRFRLDLPMKLLALTLLAASTALAQVPTPAPTTPPTQEETQQPFALTARSSLVLVPALVKTKSGQLVFTLKADDFILTDDGIPQPLHLEEDNGGQPIAVVICVEVGGAGAEHLENYKHLGPMLDALLAGVPHKVAIVAFDSVPTLVHKFSSNLDSIASTLAAQEPGDEEAAILDSVSFSVDLLRNMPTTYRRSILLLSETHDTASHTHLVDALRAISDTNTAIYSVGFSSNGSEIRHEAAKLNSDETGPAHGCFSHDPKTDPTIKDDGTPIKPEETKSTQYFDCFAQLLPPLRLAKMAEIAARNALRQNISESVAKLTGGENFKFKDEKSLERDLFTISNHIPNRYILSFHPVNPHPGLHAVTLKLKDYDNLHIEARSSYWIDDPNATAEPSASPKQP